MLANGLLSESNVWLLVTQRIVLEPQFAERHRNYLVQKHVGDVLIEHAAKRVLGGKHVEAPGAQTGTLLRAGGVALANQLGQDPTHGKEPV